MMPCWRQWSPITLCLAELSKPMQLSVHKGVGPADAGAVSNSARAHVGMRHACTPRLALRKAAAPWGGTTTFAVTQIDEPATRLSVTVCS
jgi:hypothetical protein